MAGFAWCGTSLCRCFPYNEFWVNLDDVRDLFVRELLEQGVRSERTHVLQRLPDRGQTGNNVRSCLDVVEAEYGDVAWYGESCIMKRSHATNCRDIVEAENGCEISAPQQELMNSGITKLGRIQVFVQLNDQVVGNF